MSVPQRDFVFFFCIAVITYVPIASEILAFLGSGVTIGNCIKFCSSSLLIIPRELLPLT